MSVNNDQIIRMMYFEKDQRKFTAIILNKSRHFEYEDIEKTLFLALISTVI